MQRPAHVMSFGVTLGRRVAQGDVLDQLKVGLFPGLQQIYLWSARRLDLTRSRQRRVFAVLARSAGSDRFCLGQDQNHGAELPMSVDPLALLSPKRKPL